MDPSTSYSIYGLKEAIIQTPTLCYPDPAKKYTVYMDALDDACGAQLSQEHNETEFLIAFLSYAFTETQMNWNRTGSLQSIS